MVIKNYFVRIALIASIVLFSGNRASAQESISTEESGSQESISTDNNCDPPCPPDKICDNNGNCVSNQTTAENEIRETREQIDNEIPSRVKRKNGILLETPWNGLVGLGLLYTFRPVWPMSVEGGFGLSSMGWKYGFRGRYCMINKNASPFVGFGFMRASGADGAKTKVNSVNVSFDLKPINFVQISGGYDIVTSFGLTFLIATGWAIPLNDGLRNVKYEGVPEAVYKASDDVDRDAVNSFDAATDLLYRGGLVLSFGFGFSF